MFPFLGELEFGLVGVLSNVGDFPVGAKTYGSPGNTDGDILHDGVRSRVDVTVRNKTHSCGSRCVSDRNLNL